MPPVAGAVLAGVAGGFSLTAAGTIAFSLQAALIAGAKSLVLGLGRVAVGNGNTSNNVVVIIGNKSNLNDKI